MHEEIGELLPGYALGALDAADTAAVQEHLRTCREHDDELVALRATVLALGMLADEREPSASLAAGIGAIATTSHAGEAAPSARSDILLPQTGDREAFAVRRFRGRGAWLGAAAAGLAIVLVFGAGWMAGNRLGSEERYSYVAEAEGMLVQFTGVAGSDVVTVRMAGFERLPADQRYQLWALRDDVWVSIGDCNVNPAGRWLGDFDFALPLGEEIALTVEPAPGSGQPTSEPLLRSRF